MTVEIGSSKPKAIDFSLEGKKLYVRQMPFGLGFRLQAVGEDGDIPPELVAEIVSTCVVSKDNKPVMTAAQAMELDLEPMLQLFSEVSGASTSLEDAEKN